MGEMERLQPFVGAWTIDGVTASITFEWVLDGQFLMQRSEVDVEEVPDGLSLIGPDPAGVGFLQHYFDSRGVSRVYAMQFDGRVWTLRREKPDFSPLQFWQRYSGTFSDDGTTIDGRWEISHDVGATWEVDFPLVYSRSG